MKRPISGRSSRCTSAILDEPYRPPNSDSAQLGSTSDYDRLGGRVVRVLDLHPWAVSTEQARGLQLELRERISRQDGVDFEQIRNVAGADVAYERSGAASVAHAAVMRFSFPALELLETRTARREVSFPYVPGLLSFREAPTLLEAFRQLEGRPDVVLFDAQGYAHPRRMGAASHLGLFLDTSSIGCAKSKLVGRSVEPGAAFGESSPLLDGDEQIGSVLRTRPGGKPLFVSVGHRISLELAVRVVLACCRGRSIMPEPTRQADRLVARLAHPNEVLGPRPAGTGTE
jgi:deoxyribonuclease V